MSHSVWRKFLSFFGYPIFGVCVAVFIWYCLTTFVVHNEQFGQALSPLPVFKALIELIVSEPFRQHILPSLQRVLLGLSIAFCLGVPVGLLVGYFGTLNQVTNLVFQFIRMISPLAWMPFAVLMFGIGNSSVIFLIAIAGLWPIIFSTAHGVSSIDSSWIKVVHMLGGRHKDVLLRAVVPAVLPDILAGLRISIGLSWAVLVPAEMLGVSSGLGYFILDTRDRFNYSELGAVILIIGVLGFFSDFLVRILQRQLSWRAIAAKAPL